MKPSHSWILGVGLGSLVVILMASSGPARATHRWFDEAKNWTYDPYQYMDGAFYGTRGTFFADINGDGKADAIAVNEDRIWVRLSNGCMFLPPQPLTSNHFYGKLGTFFADVDGDGKADPIAVDETGITVRQSRNGSTSLWLTERFHGTRGTFFADVDGDGKADAIAVNEDRIVVRLSDGWRSFGSEECWAGPYPYCSDRAKMFHGEIRTFFADVGRFFDKEGRRADAIFVNSTGVSVGLSMRNSPNGGYPTTNAFARETKWTDDPFYGSRGTFFADVTGDGRADAIAVQSDGIMVRDSLGNGFRAPDANGNVTEGGLVSRPKGYWTEGRFTGVRGTFFADVDGDGAADAIAVNNDGIWIRRSTFARQTTPTCPARKEPNVNPIDRIVPEPQGSRPPFITP
jgi:hypothetical protein